MKLTNFIVSFFKNEQEIFKEKSENKSLHDNCIEFNCLDYNTILDLETETLIRENDEFLFFLDIKNKSCTIRLKKENLDFDVHVDDCNLKNINNKLILEYTIETEDAKNKMIIETERKEHFYE